MAKRNRASATAQPVKLASGHRFSRPPRHYAQVPQVQPSQGMPTRSPAEKRSTPEHCAAILPIISFLATIGVRAPGSSPSIRCGPVRQTAKAATRTSTWPGPGVGGLSWLGMDRRRAGDAGECARGKNVGESYTLGAGPGDATLLPPHERVSIFRFPSLFARRSRGCRSARGIPGRCRDRPCGRLMLESFTPAGLRPTGCWQKRW